MTPQQQAAVDQRVIQEHDARELESVIAAFRPVAQGYVPKRHFLARFLRWVVGVV